MDVGKGREQDAEALLWRHSFAYFSFAAKRKVGRLRGETRNDQIDYGVNIVKYRTNKKGTDLFQRIKINLFLLISLALFKFAMKKMVTLFRQPLCKLVNLFIILVNKSDANFVAIFRIIIVLPDDVGVNTDTFLE